MPLQINPVSVGQVTKTAVFQSLTIRQNAAGALSVDGAYSIELRDESGDLVGDPEGVTFGFSQAELMANPNFSACYAAIRDLARTGLAQTNPDLVSQA